MEWEVADPDVLEDIWEMDFLAESDTAIRLHRTVPAMILSSVYWNRQTASMSDGAQTVWGIEYSVWNSQSIGLWVVMKSE